MLPALLIGSGFLVLNLAIQVFAAVLVLRFILKRLNNAGFASTFLRDFGLICAVLGMLFAGHMVQFTTWALLFRSLGEFTDFPTAFYHSVVNFATLGYGDVVMSPKWRLLGAMEGANGALMFGVSAGSLLAVMQYLFKRTAGIDAQGTRQ